MKFIMKTRHLTINKIKNRIFFLLSFTAVYMVFVLFNAGCGIKAPPLPPLKYTLTPPSNLKYLLSLDTVTLKWAHVHKKDEGIRGFKIFRAQKDLSENGCKGCPIKFYEVGSVSSRQFEYTEKIKKGFRYYYKVRAYSEDNDLSSNSNTIEFRFQ